MKSLNDIINESSKKEYDIEKLNELYYSLVDVK